MCKVSASCWHFKLSTFLSWKRALYVQNTNFVMWKWVCQCVNAWGADLFRPPAAESFCVVLRLSIYAPIALTKWLSTTYRGYIAERSNQPSPTPSEKRITCFLLKLLISRLRNYMYNAYLVLNYYVRSVLLVEYFFQVYGPSRRWGQ